jgi:hypothetical protein
MNRRTPAEIDNFNKSILSVLPKAKTKALPITAIAQAIGHKGDNAVLANSLSRLRKEGKVLTIGEKAKMVYYKK